MRFDVITLFPELFAPFLSSGINRRAFETGAVELKLWQLRDFADGTYRRVDDRPFGGGPGMVLRADVVGRACDAAVAGLVNPV
jgi:tRNA (guanine37-N1)-methyltransferase